MEMGVDVCCYDPNWGTAKYSRNGTRQFKRFTEARRYFDYLCKHTKKAVCLWTDPNVAIYEWIPNQQWKIAHSKIED